MKSSQAGSGQEFGALTGSAPEACFAMVALHDRRALKESRHVRLRNEEGFQGGLHPERGDWALPGATRMLCGGHTVVQPGGGHLPSRCSQLHSLCHLSPNCACSHERPCLNTWAVRMRPLRLDLRPTAMSSHRWAIRRVGRVMKATIPGLCFSSAPTGTGVAHDRLYERHDLLLRRRD